MQITRLDIQCLPTTLLVVVGMLVWVLSCGDVATADTYSDSAHGNSLYGVYRSVPACQYPNPSPPPDFLVCSTGSCAHCHDTFNPDICGQEGHPKMLFVTNDNDFCLKCHDNITDPSDRPIVNRSYSYRAGGWISDSLDDIREAFNSTSTHNLGDIKTFISGKWGHTADSNPCTACHNQHLAEGDPENEPNAAKSASKRGWPVSRPSEHGSGAWELWGDDATEKMSQYTSGYQAPYRYDSTTTYEPDGSTTIDGSNLTDFNSFCTDCHNTTYAIYSTSLGRNLRQIDWAVEKHGKGDADGALDEMRSPYDDVTGKVLACTDCHEAHGSPNAYLLREEVNGEQFEQAITLFTPFCSLPGTDGNKGLGWLCRKCHKDDSNYGYGVNEWKFLHHYPNYTADAPYKRTRCYRCHWTSSPGDEPISCRCCHYHGSQTTDFGENYPCYVDQFVCNGPYDRRTF